MGWNLCSFILLYYYSRKWVKTGEQLGNKYYGQYTDQNLKEMLMIRPQLKL